GRQHDARAGRRVGARRHPGERHRADLGANAADPAHHREPRRHEADRGHDAGGPHRRTGRAGRRGALYRLARYRPGDGPRARRRRRLPRAVAPRFLTRRHGARLRARPSRSGDRRHQEGDIMNRRTLVIGIAVVALVGMLASLPSGVTAQGKVVKIGLSLPLTGADADGADAILKGAQMAIAEINAKGGVKGYKLEAVVFDSATPAAGQYDPAQAATNYKKFVADTLVMAAVGPVMSGEGKAISPILSEADMATITPSSTNPDITDPKFQSQYRPKGKAVYFRTVT